MERYCSEIYRRRCSRHPSFPRHATPFDQALLSLTASYLIYHSELLNLCYWLCGLELLGRSYLHLDVQLMSGKFNIVHLPLTSIAYRTYCLDPGGREVRRVSPFHFENLADTSKATWRVFGSSVNRPHRDLSHHTPLKFKAYEALLSLCQGTSW